MAYQPHGVAQTPTAITPFPYQQAGQSTPSYGSAGSVSVQAPALYGSVQPAPMYYNPVAYASTSVPPSFGGYVTSPSTQYGNLPQQPSDLASVFSSMSLQPPGQDPNHYMDTGASSHMTFNQGF